MDIFRVPDVSTAVPPLRDRVLLLCVPAGWETYISREFYEVQQALVASGWIRLVIDDVGDAAIIDAMRHADIVLLWEAYELIERNRALLCEGATHGRARRFFFCDDVHFFTAARRDQRARAFLWAETILATYPEQLCAWYPEIAAAGVRWIPHSAASAFHPIFSPSSDRVLLSGARTWPYPFRQFCHAKLPAALCASIDHPGYPGYPGDRHNRARADTAAMQRVGGEQYAALLRRYPAMLVCGSVFGYLVAKVFEGMAAGCLVIAERVSLAGPLSALGFVEGEHYVGTDLMHVMRDVETVREMAADRGGQWDRLVRAAGDEVAAHHTTAVRARQIHTLCLTG